MVGQSILHYTILEKLGKGGMGVVYKAEDTKLERLVAIKFLPHQITASSDERQRFKVEARAAAALNHPNIATIHAIEEVGDDIFIVMEYIDGVELKELAREPGRLSIADIEDYTVQIAKGLHAAHESGIVHRDIKSANIMVTQNGHIKIMDFGLAKFYGQAGLTRTNSTLGTVSYMSPEQATNAEVDHRSDIWSFGVVLYEMLTGELPFQGKHEPGIIYAITSNQPEYDKIEYEIFRGIVKNCLEKDRKSRYQSVSEIPSDVGSDEPPSSYIRSIRPSKSKRKSRYVLLGFVCVLCLVPLFMFLFHSDESNNLPPMKTTRLTSYPGFETSPALSPDGASVAFSWNGPEQNNMDIYVKRKDGGNPVRLTTSPSPDYNPEWSRDGRYIAFVRPLPVKPRGYDIYIIPSLGGREQKIATCYPIGKVPVLSWSTDNQFVYFSQWAPQDSSVAVFKVSLQTRDVEQITSPPVKVVGDLSPSVSPDGTFLGFIRQGIEDGDEIYIQNLATNKVRQVTDENTIIQGFTWGPNSRSILFCANLDGTSALWKTDLSGKKREKILSGVSVNNPDYSPTGNCIVYNENAVKTNIWKMDLQHPNNEVLLISSSNSININPDISPDGKKIVFSSNRTGTHNIWMCNSDGTESRQLTFFDKQAKAGLALWSPLNDEILITFTGRQSYVMKLSTGQLDDIGDIGTNPLWAQNGRDFYASPYPEVNLYFLSRDGTIKKRLTNDLGLYAKLVGDTLYYFKHFDKREIWRISVDGTNEEPVLQGVKGFGIRLWDVGSQGLYYVGKNTGSSVLYYYDFESGQSTEIINIRNASGTITVDPKERYLLYAKSESNYSDIILVENFQ